MPILANSSAEADPKPAAAAAAASIPARSKPPAHPVPPPSSAAAATTPANPAPGPVSESKYDQAGRSKKNKNRLAVAADSEEEKKLTTEAARRLHLVEASCRLNKSELTESLSIFGAVIKPEILIGRDEKSTSATSVIGGLRALIDAKTEDLKVMTAEEAVMKYLPQSIWAKLPPVNRCTMEEFELSEIQVTVPITKDQWRRAVPGGDPIRIHIDESAIVHATRSHLAPGADVVAQPLRYVITAAEVGALSTTSMEKCQWHGAVETREHSKDVWVPLFREAATPVLLYSAGSYRKALVTPVWLDVPTPPPWTEVYRVLPSTDGRYAMVTNCGFADNLKTLFDGGSDEPGTLARASIAMANPHWLADIADVLQCSFYEKDPDPHRSQLILHGILAMGLKGKSADVLKSYLSPNKEKDSIELKVPLSVTEQALIRTAQNVGSCYGRAICSSGRYEHPPTPTLSVALVHLPDAKPPSESSFSISFPVRLTVCVLSQPIAAPAPTKMI